MLNFAQFSLYYNFYFDKDPKRENKIKSKNPLE